MLTNAQQLGCLMGCWQCGAGLECFKNRCLRETDSKVFQGRCVITGKIAQMVERVLSNRKVPSSNSS